MNLAACAHGMRRGAGYLRAVMGADAYDQYLRHMARLHPDEPVLGERDFWRRHLDWQNENPQGRCC